jgi:hypothetical protein
LTLHCAALMKSCWRLISTTLVIVNKMEEKKNERE